MAWEQILGFFTMWLHPEFTVLLWSKAGVPIWQTFLFTALWTSLTLTLTYFGTGWFRKRFKQKIEKLNCFFRNNNFLPENTKYHDKITKLLSPQKNWIILLCGFIPFVYGLPATVIVLAKLMEVKYALPVLLLGNAFRAGVICYTIYKSVGFFS